ncbi:MAG TPA: chorismate mutase [Thermoanaerobacterales bacterium]|nr:chorismate mutase [Thermoanaerobacterales bacterium]
MTILEDLRKEIDEIDEKLVSLFERRMEKSLDIGKYKVINNMEVLDEEREKEIIKKNVKKLKNSEFAKELEEFLLTIMDLSKKLQNERFTDR